jgi:hypothetical protein
MSVGNLKTQGNQGNNFPYQLRTLQLLAEINTSITALPGVDHESRTSTYQAINNGVGYSIGDIIVRYDIIDLATGLLDSTLWFNQTTQAQITPAPLPGDLTPISAPSSVSVSNGPGAAAVNIQDGGNIISVDDAGSSLTVDDGGVALATYPFPANPIKGAVENLSTTSPATLFASGAYTVYITQLLVTNAHATVGTVVNIQDGSGKIYVGYAAPAGGGFSINFPTPLETVGGSTIEVTCNTTGSSIYVSANGFYL